MTKTNITDMKRVHITIDTACDIEELYELIGLLENSLPKYTIDFKWRYRYEEEN